MGFAPIPEDGGGLGRSTRPRYGGERHAIGGSVRRRRAAEGRRDSVCGQGSGGCCRRASLERGMRGGGGLRAGLTVRGRRPGRQAKACPTKGLSYFKLVSKSLRMRLYSSAQLLASTKVWSSTGYGATRSEERRVGKE